MDLLSCYTQGSYLIQSNADIFFCYWLYSFSFICYIWLFNFWYKIFNGNELIWKQMELLETYSGIGQHRGCWWLGANAPGHQHPQHWLHIVPKQFHENACFNLNTLEIINSFCVIDLEIWQIIPYLDYTIHGIKLSRSPKIDQQCWTMAKPGVLQEASFSIHQSC